MSSASYQKKQATAMYESWKRSRYDDLGSAYKSYSPAKARAWRYCQNLCNELGGTGL